MKKPTKVPFFARQQIDRPVVVSAEALDEVSGARRMLEVSPKR